MMILVSCLLIVVTAASETKTKDPCIKNKVLPNVELRSVDNKFKIVTDTALSDRKLKNDWYITNGHDIVREPPDLLSCGTIFPIWMDGNLPSVTEGEVKRTACVRGLFSNCDDDLEIKVKNCGTFYVYYLKHSKGDNEAYCFDQEEIGDKPTYVPPSVTVDVALVDHPVHDVYYSEARCVFEEGDQPYYYFISWYIDGEFLKISPALRYEDIKMGYLRMSKDVIQSLGRKIKCSVFVRLQEDGPNGQIKESPEKFVGIEILTSTVTIRRGEVGHISVRPTLGFSCFPKDSVCDLPLILSAPRGCSDVNVIGKGNCWVDLASTEWNNIYNITIQSKEGGKHEFTATFHVALQTSVYQSHDIWSSYRTEEITVNVLESVNRGGLIATYCQARDDPHMRTFDQRPYEIQYEGEFVMYKHEDYPMQVQVKSRPCRSRGRPYCVCAVAIQAGADVFVVDRCVSSSKKRTDFAACGDNVLDVRRTSSRRYTVYFPTGTRVQVDLRPRTLTVQIYPSIRDWNKTSGLCGVLSKNCPDDFLMSNGTLFEDKDTRKPCNVLSRFDFRFHPNTFSQSWTITQSNSINLFETDGVDDRLTSWSVSYLLCQCTLPKPGDADQTPAVDCKSSMVTECDRTGTSVVSADHCKIKTSTKRNRLYTAFGNGKESRRIKRSTQLDQYVELMTMLAKLPIDDVTKAIAENWLFLTKQTDHVEMTMEEAIEYCTKALFDVPSFKLCSDVPNVNTNDSIALCALDILISNSTEWVDASIESLKMRCLEELNLNDTLHEDDEHGISIAETIQSIACPEECSGEGVCSNGTCICRTGFGASDCSINLSIPPYFDSILDDGMCDTREWSCDVAVITGDDFVEFGNPVCKVRPFHITRENAVLEETEQVVDASVQTLMNLYCPLPVLFSDTELADVFVKGYTISLSNDGHNFGDEQRIYVFDSLCQTPVEVNGEPGFELRTGYCFIDNACVSEEGIDPENECQMCLSSINGFAWSSTEDTECALHQTPPTKKYWIIGAVLGAFVVAAVVVAAVVWRLKYIKIKKIEISSPNFHSPTYGVR